MLPALNKYKQQMLHHSTNTLKFKMSIALVKTVTAGRLFSRCTRYSFFQDTVVRHLDVGPKGTFIAKKVPTMVKLEAGKKYAWCKCGLSKKQPFCDGAHKPTAFKPVMIKLDKTKSVLLCRCKQTSNEPYCDNTHIKILMSSIGKRLGLVKQ